MCLHCGGKVSKAVVGVDRPVYALSSHTCKHKPYIKSHLELQREITLIELAPSPYFLIKSICLVDMNMFARCDEIPALSLQDIKETKHYRWTHKRTHERENRIPPQTQFDRL